MACQKMFLKCFGNILKHFDSINKIFSFIQTMSTIFLKYNFAMW
jgi:hypothetical protein